MSAACWPDRLIGATPNFYLYAANNPSEGTIAKRRSGATLISYLSPPVTSAGLYRGLTELKASLQRWRQLEDTSHERAALEEIILSQAKAVDLAETDIGKLVNAVHELEYTLIPHGLHVVGEPVSDEERKELLQHVADASDDREIDLAAMDALLREDHEVPALLRALDGRFIRPSAAATSSARRRSCPQAATSTASTRSAFRRPSPSWMARVRRHWCSTPMPRRAGPCPRPSPWCCGVPTT